MDGVEAAMMQRLQDKAPGVRAEAAAVLARLAQPDEVRILGRKDLAVTTIPIETLTFELQRRIRQQVLHLYPHRVALSGALA